MHGGGDVGQLLGRPVGDLANLLARLEVVVELHEVVGVQQRDAALGKARQVVQEQRGVNALRGDADVACGRLHDAVGQGHRAELPLGEDAGRLGVGDGGEGALRVELGGMLAQAHLVGSGGLGGGLFLGKGNRACHAGKPQAGHAGCSALDEPAAGDVGVIAHVKLSSPRWT